MTASEEKIRQQERLQPEDVSKGADLEEFLYNTLKPIRECVDNCHAQLDDSTMLFYIERQDIRDKIFWAVEKADDAIKTFSMHSKQQARREAIQECIETANRFYNESGFGVGKNLDQILTEKLKK